MSALMQTGTNLNFALVRHGTVTIVLSVQAAMMTAIVEEIFVARLEMVLMTCQVADGEEGLH